jgi:hypothetical protein
MVFIVYLVGGVLEQVPPRIIFFPATAPPWAPDPLRISKGNVCAPKVVAGT